MGHFGIKYNANVKHKYCPILLIINIWLKAKRTTLLVRYKGQCFQADSQNTIKYELKNVNNSSYGAWRHIYEPGLKYPNMQISNQYSNLCLFYLFILKCGIIHNGLTFYNSIDHAINPTVIIFRFCSNCLREALIYLRSF